MGGNLIHLTDGSTLEVKFNFYTLYLMNQTGLARKGKNAKKHDGSMEDAAKLIYCILRSNGRKVDKEEAMMLVPPDTEEIQLLFDEFGKKLDDYKKKEESKRTTIPNRK